MAKPITEHGQLMSGGGFEIRSADPAVERIYPTAEWIEHIRNRGGHVYQRRVIVIEDWTEIKK